MAPAPAAVASPPPVEDGFDLKAEVESEPGSWFVAPAAAPSGKDLFGDDAGDEGLFDLAAELEKDEDQGQATATGGMGFSTSEEFSVEETLSAFKRGVAKTISEHDSTTHFDLGIAFKEMGLSNDAIGEFFTASRDPARYSECMMMASMIMRENGELHRAIETCRTALSSEGIGGKDAASLYFELGQALATLGRQENALWAIQQGQALDPEFGDLSNLLSKFQGVAPATLSLTEPLPDLPDAPPPGDGPFDGGTDEGSLSMDDLGEDELDAAFGDEPAAEAAPVQVPEPTPEAGPPPSREPTTWEKAALESPPAEAEGQPEPKKKSQKKISYV